MKHGPLERARESFHRHFAPRRNSVLLVTLIFAFALRPLIGDIGAGSAVFSVALVLLLLVALYNINVDDLVGERGRLLAQSRRRRILGWMLAAAALTERVLLFLHQNRTLQLVDSIVWLLFVLFITVSQLRSVLKQREVTGETICMAVSVYLLLGFTWAFIYAVMFQLNPESFGGLPAAQPGHFEHIFPVIGYFSLTTLSTIGFGDITPLTLQARYLAVAEGITGQFYLAILIARLVGMQMSRAASQQRRSQTPDHSTKQSANGD